MSWRPRLVASDLDGTLLRSDLSVSERTVRCVRAIEATGTPFVLVSGRPPRWLIPVAEQLAGRGTAVCANGALIWDLASGRMTHSDPLAPDVLADVAVRLRTAIPGVAFGVERDGLSFHHETAYSLAANLPRDDAIAVETDALLAEPAVKLLVREPGTDSDTLAARAREVLGDAVTVTHSNPAGLLEISAVGVTKATGLARVAEAYDVPAEDVIVFGDMPNDLPMFAWAGRAVAVADAHPDVRDAADEVTGSNDEDGVAAYLERLLDLG